MTQIELKEESLKANSFRFTGAIVLDPLSVSVSACQPWSLALLSVLTSWWGPLEGSVQTAIQDFSSYMPALIKMGLFPGLYHSYPECKKAVL